MFVITYCEKSQVFVVTLWAVAGLKEGNVFLTAT